MIEGSYGLGEVVVGGQVEPDTYVVDKSGPTVLETRIGAKSFQIVRGTDGHDCRIDVEPGLGALPLLDADEVVDLTRLGIRVEEHYGVPQDIEWAISDRGDTFLVQSRPITTMADEHQRAGGESGVPSLLTGLGASPGVAVGPVRVLHAPSEGDRLEAGEVLVAPMTAPDWIPVIRRAAALVTDGGGMTCHAAIVSRELGVPCVVGTRRATTTLVDGTTVTVDGKSGLIYEGDVAVAPRGPNVPECRGSRDDRQPRPRSNRSPRGCT